MWLSGSLRFRLAAAGEDLPVCGFPGWAGSPGCLVDVTLYLFLQVRCVTDQVRLAGQMG
jgi:hypothetical protein